MNTTYNVIDSDGHVLEPPKMWAEFLDPAFRDRAPEIFIDTDGKSRLRLEGKVLGGNGNTGFATVGGIDMRNGGPPPSTYEEGRRGGFDPQARIVDLDLDGIDAAFLYPTIGLITCGSVEDPEFSAAMCRAYNRWLAEYCAPYPDRLFGVAMLPMQSVEHAVEEARFARETLGFRGAFVRPNPFNNRLLCDPAYDPLWQLAQDLDISISVHEGTGGMPAAGVDRVEGPSARHITSHTVEMMLASLNLIWGGVCERFPRVRFAFLEGGGGWMAGWLDRMDRHFDEGNRADAPPGRPSDYFRRQCWISFEPAEGSIGYLAEYLGADKILWATDYPHRDGFFPGAPKLIADKLPERLQRQVLAGGAIGFYNL